MTDFGAVRAARIYTLATESRNDSTAVGSQHRSVASLFHRCTRSETLAALRPVLFHFRAKEEVRALPRDVRVKLGAALMALQRGFNLDLLLRRLTEMLNAYEEDGGRS